MLPNFHPLSPSDFAPYNSHDSKINLNSLQNISYFRSLASQKFQYDRNLLSSPQSLNIHQMIPYQLKLMWKQELTERRIIEGAIKYQQTMTITQIQKAIQKDISDSSIKFRDTTNMFIRLVKQHKVIVQVMRHGHSSRQVFKINKQKIEGILIESKINLPRQYGHLPDKFEGFVIPKLTIFNSFGRVDWQSPVDIQNVDFSKGLELSRQSFICDIPALQTHVVITFYNLPCKIERILSKGETEGLFQKIKKSVQEKDKNCNVLWLDVSSSTWLISINFHKEK